MRAHIASKITATLFCAVLGLGAPAFAARQAAASKTTATPSTTKKATARRVVRKRKTQQRVQTAPTPARISEIQSTLGAQGAYKAPPNGKWGSATTQAMYDLSSSH